MLLILFLASFQARSAASWAVKQNRSDYGRINPAHSTETPYTDSVTSRNGQSALTFIRLELPFSVNGQSVTLSGQIMYRPDTQTVVSSSLFLSGPGAPDEQANYVSPVAAYNTDGSIEFIGNLGFQYKATRTRDLVEGAGAAVTLSAGPKAQLISEHSQQQPCPIYPSNILYVRFTIDSRAGRGQGEVQINGTKGPVYKYRITPQ